MGIKRDLYWNARVDFQPVILDHEEWECSLAFEWLTWPVRRWRDLDGMGLRELRHPQLVECSLYLFAQHHPASLRHLNLRENGSASFEIDFSAIAEIDDESGRRLFNISGQCDLGFKGIIVVPSNLHPKPSSALEARSTIAEFLDLDDLKEPRSEEWRYVIEPIF
jgi:hypothetical protein